MESEPDVSKIQLAPARDHFLVLGSDGLFESLSTREIGSIAKHAMDASKEKDGMGKYPKTYPAFHLFKSLNVYSIQ